MSINNMQIQIIDCSTSIEVTNVLICLSFIIKLYNAQNVKYVHTVQLRIQPVFFSFISFAPAIITKIPTESHFK